MAIERDLATVVRFSPVHSNANDKYEYWILHAELGKMVSCALGSGGTPYNYGLARFSFGILFWWIVQYV